MAKPKRLLRVSYFWLLVSQGVPSKRNPKDKALEFFGCYQENKELGENTKTRKQGTTCLAFGLLTKTKQPSRFLAFVRSQKKTAGKRKTVEKPKAKLLAKPKLRLRVLGLLVNAVFCVLLGFACTSVGPIRATIQHNVKGKQKKRRRTKKRTFFVALLQGNKRNVDHGGGGVVLYKYMNIHISIYIQSMIKGIPTLL